MFSYDAVRESEFECAATQREVDGVETRLRLLIRTAHNRYPPLFHGAGCRIGKLSRTTDASSGYAADQGLMIGEAADVLQQLPFSQAPVLPNDSSRALPQNADLQQQKGSEPASPLPGMLWLCASETDDQRQSFFFHQKGRRQGTTGAGTSCTALGAAGATARTRWLLPAAEIRPAPQLSVVSGTRMSAR